MGYTHQYTKLSIGLGVSSISDSWYGFAQNIKSVEKYLQQISEEQFPLIKGHILTKEDLIVRRIILDIMCKRSAVLPDDDIFCPNFSEGLKSLEADGLLITKGNEITVTTTGLAFLRNICMCFDQKLLTNAPESQIFSTAV